MLSSTRSSPTASATAARTTTRQGNEPRYSYPSNPLDQILDKPWSALPEGYCRDYVNPATPCTESPRGRDYFGGDLKGVDQQLDYLQSIGVNTIYFNPIFDAASDHAYDTQNYYAIDPFFGTQKDWDNLEQARQPQPGMQHHSRRRLQPRLVRQQILRPLPPLHRRGRLRERSLALSLLVLLPASGGRPVRGSRPGPNTMTYTAWFGFDSLPVLNKNVQAVRDLFYAQPTTASATTGSTRVPTAGVSTSWAMAPSPTRFWQGFRTVDQSHQRQTRLSSASSGRRTRCCPRSTATRPTPP